MKSHRKHVAGSIATLLAHVHVPVHVRVREHYVYIDDSLVTGAFTEALLLHMFSQSAQARGVLQIHAVHLFGTGCTLTLECSQDMHMHLCCREVCIRHAMTSYELQSYKGTYCGVQRCVCRPCHMLLA